MTLQSQNLGGRLPLLDPAKLSEKQREVYDRTIATMVPWADADHFQTRTADGRLIGPFNPVLFAPEMASCFADLQAAEAKYTPLSERVRQVVILQSGRYGRQITSCTLTRQSLLKPVCRNPQSDRLPMVDLPKTCPTRSGSPSVSCDS
jgi:hypothetical protein